jgi:hypothetical protein
MKKPPALGPAAFPDRSVAGGNDREISRRAIQKQAADSERYHWGPFQAVELICHHCPRPHVLALAFIRFDRPDIPPTALFFSDAAGAT